MNGIAYASVVIVCIVRRTLKRTVYLQTWCNYEDTSKGELSNVESLFEVSSLSNNRRSLSFEDIELVLLFIFFSIVVVPHLIISM